MDFYCQKRYLEHHKSEMIEAGFKILWINACCGDTARIEYTTTRNSKDDEYKG